MALVLFVDDDPFTLEMLTKAVQLFGHQSILAKTGQEAIVVATQQSPDLIFIDMSLPDMNGLSLIAELRKQPPTAQIPILMLSAEPEAETSPLARAAGAQAYISKPIRLQDLMDTIQEYTTR